MQDDKGLVNDYVHVGHVFPVSRSECTRQTRRVANVQVHPCYCGVKKCGEDIIELQNDVAVLTVDAPFYFNEFVQPACLPDFKSATPAGTMALVVGFGHIDYDTGETPSSLQYVKKPVQSQQTCEEKHKDVITDDMLCAGFEEGGKDACVGDSGGGLVVVDEDNLNKPVKLIGVVSWGVDCAKEWPGVYANISHNVDWIIQEALRDVEGGSVRRRRRRRKKKREADEEEEGGDAEENEEEEKNEEEEEEGRTEKRPGRKRGQEGDFVTEFDTAECSAYFRRRSTRGINAGATTNTTESTTESMMTSTANVTDSSATTISPSRDCSSNFLSFLIAGTCSSAAVNLNLGLREVFILTIFVLLT